MAEKRGGLRQAMAAALAAAAVLGTSTDSLADLNSLEANTRGEFGIGSAVQFGSADLKYVKLQRALKFYSFRNCHSHVPI